MKDSDREALAMFARGASMHAPSGHAPGQVVGVYADAVVVDFGEAYAWFRLESFPDVVVGDFVTIGPGVSRWGITLKGSQR